MDESYQTSSNLETRNSAVNDQTLDDADAINDNIEPTKKARGMSIEYLEVIVVEDYSLALTYMINSMPDYRYKHCCNLYMVTNVKVATMFRCLKELSAKLHYDFNPTVLLSQFF